MAKYLEFIVEKQSYAVPVEVVWSIFQAPNVIKIPRTPVHVLGVMDLDGQIVPIIDLRSLWKLPQKNLSEGMLAIGILYNNLLFVILVDEVTDLVDADAGNIKRRDGMEQNIASSYINYGGRTVMLVDVQLLVKQLQYC